MDLDHPEQLLDHGQLVRSLASALLADDDVDDVVQGTWTAAMTGARPAGWPLPQWLAGVARNLARRSHRDRRRRAARELQAARPEALRSAAEVVEFEELRQRVVAAVLALGEPQRSVVLLRFYDGLPPRAIARRLGMEPSTVRSHLHRALASLRARLDRDWRGGRAAWTALLLPLQTTGLPVKEPMTMTKAMLWTLLAAPAVLCLLLFLETPPASTPHDVAAPRADSTPVAAPAATVPPRVAASAPPPAPVPAAPPAVQLRFLDGDRPVPGDELRQRFAGTRTAASAMLLDLAALDRGGVDGLVACLFGPPDAWQTHCALDFTADGAAIGTMPGNGTFQLLIARPQASAMLTPAFELPAKAPLAFDVPLPVAHALRTLRFVAADTGAALAGAAVHFYTEFGDDRGFVAGTTLQTDARGECVLAAGDLPNPRLIRTAICWLEATGHAGRVSLGGDDAFREVRIEPRGRVEGTALLPGGAPAAGLPIVVAANKGPALRGRVGDDGRFALDGVPATGGLCVLLDARGAMLGNQEVAVPPAAAVKVRFGAAEAGASVRGRVTVGAEPLASVLAMVDCGRRDRRLATTAADGSYAFDGVPAGARLGLMLGDPGVADDFRIEHVGPLASAPGAALVFDFDLPRGRIPVRVVDAASGEPLAGVPVVARPKAATQTNRFPGFTFRAGWAVRTDADGKALLRGLPEGEAHELRAGGRGFTSATVDVQAPALDDRAEAIVLRIARQ